MEMKEISYFFQNKFYDIQKVKNKKKIRIFSLSEKFSHSAVLNSW